jgi:hypothetical protein
MAILHLAWRCLGGEVYWSQSLSSVEFEQADSTDPEHVRVPTVGPMALTGRIDTSP